MRISNELPVPLDPLFPDMTPNLVVIRKDLETNWTSVLEPFVWRRCLQVECKGGSHGVLEVLRITYVVHDAGALRILDIQVRSAEVLFWLAWVVGVSLYAQSQRAEGCGKTCRCRGRPEGTDSDVVLAKSVNGRGLYPFRGSNESLYFGGRHLIDPRLLHLPYGLEHLVIPCLNLCSESVVLRGAAS